MGQNSSHRKNDDRGQGDADKVSRKPSNQLPSFSGKEAQA
jgi:hypothetical protein